MCDHGNNGDISCWETAFTVKTKYPQGLGPTVPELVDAASAANALVHRKTEFPLWSASARKALLAHLGTDALPFRSVLLCGIEAHVCVLQTALALAAEDIAVHVMLDGVASGILSSSTSSFLLLLFSFFFFFFFFSSSFSSSSSLHSIIHSNISNLW